jgi:FMN phosphatase YigB (HAD superfamily)
MAMPLRVGFDMDGVLADLARAFYDVERQLTAPDDAAVWAAIRQTPDFWRTLQPLEPGAVRRIHEMTLRHRWETFFITQRPATDGDTVQRQTQRWLVAEGFDLPSVIVLDGARGAAAGALRLDYHVDDNASHCVDIRAESTARPILILDDDDQVGIASARRLGIATVNGIGAALDLLDQASDAQSRPTILKQLAQLVGWK